MKLRKIPLSFLILILGATWAYAKRMPKFEQMRQLTPEQSALINRAIAQEKVIIKNIQQRTPLVETYIQDTRPDVKLYEVPVDDYYMLSRVDFGKGFFDKVYDPRQDAKRGFFRGSLDAMSGLSKMLGLEKFTYNPNGFMEMMFIDPTGFDRQHYDFSFVRREFLGSVRTWVFDVHPKVPGMGRFFGRIWVEDEGGNIVRFNGTYTGPSNQDSSKYYFHFDSWRMNMQPGLWLPVEIYVEESQRASDKSEGLKAQTHFWGYSLKLPTRESENVSIKVDDAVDQSGQSQDVGPLQASRMWIEQAEDNVIDRLVQAGLVAPLDPNGYEQKVLDQIVINLVVPNNLAFTEQVRCRVLLTDTIEATTVGNTILLSRGLINTLPDEPAFAAVISMELAHIALGHHIDTRYAFNDRLLFPDASTFQRIDMYHSDGDDQTAAAQAMKYLENSMYKDQLAEAGLYFEQLQDREKELKALNTPKLGDSLLQPDGVPWMDALAKMAPKINWNDMSQTAALPLGSWIKIDPWDDTVHMLDAKRYAPMNAREKMPFEVTPVYFNLQRYVVAAEQPPAAPAGQPADQQPTAAQAQPAGDATAQQPAEAAPNPQ
ncbi:MAG TPA: M48 family metalloprotease [Terracidiphilus sp.]|nr:M48 family metalloprotease [Terracidiphilus sp.]